MQDVALQALSRSGSKVHCRVRIWEPCIFSSETVEDIQAKEKLVREISSHSDACGTRVGAHSKSCLVQSSCDSVFLSNFSVVHKLCMNHIEIKHFYAPSFMITPNASKCLWMVMKKSLAMTGKHLVRAMADPEAESEAAQGAPQPPGPESFLSIQEAGLVEFASNLDMHERFLARLTVGHFSLKARWPLMVTLNCDPHILKTSCWTWIL